MVMNKRLKECFFGLGEHQTTIPREIVAGVTTFLTMSYILVVQPTVLSQDFSGQPTGLEAGAVLLVTCLASAFATGLMELYARLPVALAPGMGQNFFFVSVIMALNAQDIPGVGWKNALGIVIVAGIVFVVPTMVGFRAVVLNVMSPALHSAITVGIGVFIAFIGLRNANIVADTPSLVALNVGNLVSVDSGVFWAGLLTTIVLMLRGVPGSMLIGIATATIVAWSCSRIGIEAVFGLPQFQQGAVLQFDFRAAFMITGLSYVAVFVFMDIFDTTGTLIGVSRQAGLLKDGEVLRMREAMLADSVGTVVGACLGTSTVTSYIESAAGVQLGGRSDLTGFDGSGFVSGRCRLQPTDHRTGRVCSDHCPGACDRRSHDV